MVSCKVSEGEAFDAQIGRITSSGVFIAAAPNHLTHTGLSYTDSVTVTFHTKHTPRVSFRGHVATWVKNRGFRVEALPSTPKETMRILSAWAEGEPAEVEEVSAPSAPPPITQEVFGGPPAAPLQSSPSWRAITREVGTPSAGDTIEDSLEALGLSSQDLDTGSLSDEIVLNTLDIEPIEEEPVFDPWKDPSESKTPHGLYGTRVLVIDDDPGVLKMLERMLTREGCHVTTTSNPPHGLALLDQAQVDAVLLDWRLPVIPGQQMLKVIKSCNAELPVAVISGVVFQDAALADIHRLGASKVIRKPLDKKALTGWLATVA